MDAILFRPQSADADVWIPESRSYMRIHVVSVICCNIAGHIDLVAEAPHTIAYV